MDLEGVETFLDLEGAVEAIHFREGEIDAVLAGIDDRIRRFE